MPNKLWDNTEMNVIVSIDPWMTSDEYRNVISPGLQTECHQPWTPDDEIYCDSKFIGGGNQSASH